MKKLFWICAAIILHCGAATATVSLINTRIIYPAHARFVDITAENSGKQSAQLLAWVDDGDFSSTPGTATAPFLLAPAVKVLGPGRKQVLRISYNGSPLPLDRETVYYLNVTEIPPKVVAQQDAPVMQFAVRTRIKIFMRPANLPFSPELAAKKLSWELGAASGDVVLRAKNPSPYFVSMASVKLMRGDAMLSDLSRGMVPPWGELEFRPAQASADLAGADAVKYIYVGDYGGGEELTFTLPVR